MEIICRAGKMSPRERKNIRLLFPELLHKHIPPVTRVRRALAVSSRPTTTVTRHFTIIKTSDHVSILIRLPRVTAVPWRQRRGASDLFLK